MNGQPKFLKLLIVDDFPTISDRISRLLSPLGLLDQVVHVRTLRGIEQPVLSLQPHIVVMDLHVGNDSTLAEGIEAISTIKATMPNIKLVVFTNFVGIRYRQLSEGRGADFFLDKTFESEQLIDIVITIFKTINSHKP